MPQTGAHRRCASALPRGAISAIGLSLLASTGMLPVTEAQGQTEGGAVGQSQQVPPQPGRMLDLGNATCAQFLSLSRMEKDQIVLWLAGYYAGSAQRPRIDVSLLAGASNALDELCAKAPATSLIGQETRPLLLR